VFIKAKDDGGGGDNWTTGAISRAALSQTTNCSCYLGGGLPCLLSALWCQYPKNKSYNL